MFHFQWEASFTSVILSTMGCALHFTVALVSALLGLYPGVMGVRWDPCSLIAATFLDSGNGLEMEILTKLLISPVPPETQNTKHIFALWEFSPVGFT